MTASAARLPFVLGLLLSCLSLASASGTVTTTNSTLRARGSALADQIERDNALAASTGTRYLSSQAAAIADRRLVALDESEIVAVNSRIAVEKSAVVKAAVDAYVNGGSDTELGLLFAKDPDQVTVGQTYLNFAQRQLRTVAAVLGDDEHVLVVESTTELATAQRAEQAANASAIARESVLGTLRSEQSTLSSVNGQLARLAAQQAAAAAAAAAARAATTAAAGPPAPSSVALTSSPIPSGSLASDFAGIRNCESSGDYSLNSGNGYYGAYQFSAGTWEGLGESGLASSATPAEQDAAAYRLYQRSGFSPWPTCAAVLGLG